MPEAAVSNLYSRNCEAFAKRLPTLWNQIQDMTPSSKVRMENGKAVNILIGEQPLYPKPAEDWAREQLDHYFKNPDRIGFSDPTHCNISFVTRQLLDKISGFFAAGNVSSVARFPEVDVGYAFVFGIGLGLHVRDLIERDLARHMVFVEPIPEFILHSFHSVDWSEIFDLADEKKIKLKFIVGRSIQDTVHDLSAVITQTGKVFLNGSYSFLGYYSWDIVETRSLFNERIQVFLNSTGFFEDEIRMMTNSYGNFIHWSWGAVDRKPHLRQDIPVFIIGSGPSLDIDLPVVKKWRDRALVVSCGTALGILLKNGVRPDIHVENENLAVVYDNTVKLRDQYGLEDIIYLATNTSDPRIGALFDKRWYYFRTALSPGVLLPGGIRPIVGASPLVANAAFSAVATMGLRNIYLFGVDCGRAVDGEHHSKDVIYFDGNWEDHLKKLDKLFNRVVPGNFGGDVLTNRFLDSSRVAFISAQRIFKAELFNCGHGARIDGARPKVGSALSFDYPPGKQADVIRKLESQMMFFQPGEFLDRSDLQGIAANARDFPEAFNRMIDDAISEDKGFWEFERRLTAFRDDNFDRFKGILAVIGSSLGSAVRLGAYGGNRILDAEERRNFLDFFLREYRKTSLWMAGETQLMLDEMARRQEVLTPVGTQERYPA